MKLLTMFTVKYGTPIADPSSNVNSSASLNVNCGELSVYSAYVPVSELVVNTLSPTCFSLN